MVSNEGVDTLVIVSVGSTQVDELAEHLVRGDFVFTRVEDAGFFQETSVSFLVGISGDRLSGLLDLIRKVCQRRKRFIPAQAMEAPMIQTHPLFIEGEVGGASIFAVPVETFRQF